MMIQFKIYERKDSKWVSRPNLSRKFKNEDEMIDYLKVNLKMDKRSPEHKFKYTIKYLRGNKMNNAEKELIKRLVDKLATKIKAAKKQLEKQIFVSESDKCAKEAFNDELLRVNK